MILNCKNKIQNINNKIKKNVIVKFSNITKFKKKIKFILN